MNKSDTSYLLTVMFFAAGFIGFAIAATAFMTIWLGCLGTGILLFLFRIVRGDD